MTDRVGAVEAARALRAAIDEVEAGGQVLIDNGEGGQVILLNPHEHAEMLAALDEAGSRGDRRAIATARWIERHPYGPQTVEDLLDLPEAR